LSIVHRQLFIPNSYFRPSPEGNMKQPILYLTLALLVAATRLPAQNVGIGTTTPQTKLHVNGAWASTPATVAAAAAPVIPTNTSHLRLTATAGVQANALLAPASATEGQLLIVSNEDADPAFFAGVAIPASTGIAQFIYLNGAWKPMGFYPTSGAGWLITGNAGTTPGPNFLGTTDNTAMEIRVNGQRVMRYEPALVPNVLGGSINNVILPGVVGGTIAGGGRSIPIVPNAVYDNYGFVGGGEGNAVGDNAGTTSDASHATVVGGVDNSARAAFSFIGGGSENFTQGAGIFGTIAGGITNEVSGYIGTVAGGEGNQVQHDYGVISGGYNNKIYDTNGNYGTICGGVNHEIKSDYATIGGGEGIITESAYQFTLGRFNTLTGGNPTAWVATDPFFTIGNGTNFFTRSNAFTMLKNGNTAFGPASPGVKVDVDGAIAARPAATINLTAPVTNLDPATDNRTTYLLNPDALPAARQVTLSNGTVVGQLIILHCVSNSANGFSLVEAGNIRHSGGGAGTFSNQDFFDSISLLWNGTVWAQVAFAGNN
jgi:hypothetical protein